MNNTLTLLKNHPYVTQVHMNPSTNIICVRFHNDSVLEVDPFGAMLGSPSVLGCLLSLCSCIGTQKEGYFKWNIVSILPILRDIHAALLSTRKENMELRSEVKELRSRNETLTEILSLK